MNALFTIIGIVKKGAQKGREFGYPTANISLEEHVPAGVYASIVSFEGKTNNAETFIGSAVTFGDPEYKSESFLLDFDGDLYGKTLTINLYSKIRDNMNFDSEIELIKQMKQDEVLARVFFNKFF